jgi:hypothetical protein
MRSAAVLGRSRSLKLDASERARTVHEPPRRMPSLAVAHLTMLLAAIAVGWFLLAAVTCLAMLQATKR